MPTTMRALSGAALLLSVAASTASAQASLYLPLDDSRLPLIEHLIGRGDIADPSPMIRPFRVSDALRVLAEADTAPATASGRAIHALRQSIEREELVVPDREAHWRLEARAGGQAYTQKRRDLLHTGGPKAANPYADFALQGVFGPVAASARLAAEPRLIGDPDWPNQAQEHFTGRLLEGYLSAQFRFGGLTYGQLNRNWGPVGLPGIPLSDVAYERQGLALELGTRTVRLTALAADLRRQTDSIGQSVNRYFFAHRLDAQLSRQVRVGVWEALVIAGVGRTFETPFANPLSLGVLANSFGIADTGSNIMIGLDASIGLGRRTKVQIQGAVDDFWFNKRFQKQDRWALTVAGYGALGSRLGWRGWYTQASSLAFRTANPQEDFTDQGVGIGRNFADMDQASGAVTIPVAGTWLVAPELAFQRQGEGRIDAPYPPLVNGVQVTPMLFIGTVERTYRLAVGVSGRQGPVDLTANAGLHHVTNAGNLPGVTANRFVGTIQATLSWRRRGRLR
jgi:hypothetical protein